MSNVQLGYTQVIDPISFKSIPSGKIYIGEYGTLPNPANAGTWKQAYFVNSDGTRTAASQPIATNAAGYAVDGSGNIKSVQVDGQYSILVQSSLGATKFSIAKPSNTISVSDVDLGDGRTQADKNAESVSVKDFGAKGDGVTNDTVAFKAAGEYITAAGGGELIIPPGSYVVGSQTFAGANGLGYAYLASDIIKIVNCTKPVTIRASGVKIKFADGLRFGSFDPVTGAPNAPALPNTNQNYGADVGIVFNLQNNSAGVTIYGPCELDGNQSNVILGGQWGDTGYQRSGYGIRAYGNSSVSVYGVYSHHQCTDGAVFGWAGAVEGGAKTPVTLVDCRFRYNARQGCSWVGGIGFTAINSDFSHTGKGTFNSAPGAGLDIEAESAVCRDGTFINCTFGGNTGYGAVADSGDSADVHFIDCKFYGTTQNALWPKKPRMRFTNCLIAGGAVNCYNSPNEADRVRFDNCTFSANKTFEGVAATFSPYLADFTGQNPIFDSCIFVTNSASVRLQTTSASATYTDATMLQNGSVSQALPKGVFYGNRNTITLTTGSADLSGSTNYGKLVVTGTVLGVGVSPAGEVNNAALPATAAVVGFGSNGAIFLASKLAWLYQAPTSGTWTRGDRVINNNPTVGQPKGWICTVSGTPGTWVSEGNL